MNQTPEKKHVQVNLYKAVVNGETVYKKAKNMETAKNQLIRIIANKTGHACLTDIKLYRENVEPRRARTRQKEYFANRNKYARPYNQ